MERTTTIPIEALEIGWYGQIVAFELLAGTELPEIGKRPISISENYMINSTGFG